MAEWHTPIRYLDDYRRDQLYPYAETFCVLREPTQHLASVAGYHMGPDSANDVRLNSWILDKFQKFERGAFDGLGGHLWPQTYFTKDCDIVLRYESLASDLNALTKRVGCAVKAPENFVKPPGYGSSRGDLAPSLSYEVLAKAKQIYREDYLLYERLRKMDVRARVDPPRRRRRCTHTGRDGRGRVSRRHDL